MLLSEYLEVHVDDLAARRVVLVEVAHHVLRLVADCEELLFTIYLSVLAVSLVA